MIFSVAYYGYLVSKWAKTEIKTTQTDTFLSIAWKKYLALKGPRIQECMDKYRQEIHAAQKSLTDYKDAMAAVRPIEENRISETKTEERRYQLGENADAAALDQLAGGYCVGDKIVVANVNFGGPQEFYPGDVGTVTGPHDKLIPVGCAVRIRGLQEVPQHNGRRGIVVRCHRDRDSAPHDMPYEVMMVEGEKSQMMVERHIQMMVTHGWPPPAPLDSWVRSAGHLSLKPANLLLDPLVASLDPHRHRVNVKFSSTGKCCNMLTDDIRKVDIKLEPNWTTRYPQTTSPSADGLADGGNQMLMLQRYLKLAAREHIGDFQASLGGKAPTGAQMVGALLQSIAAKHLGFWTFGEPDDKNFRWYPQAQKEAIETFTELLDEYKKEVQLPGAKTPYLRNRLVVVEEKLRHCEDDATFTDVWPGICCALTTTTIACSVAISKTGIAGGWTAAGIALTAQVAAIYGCVARDRERER
eukprot:COSAG05_NODE_404_length_10192_cov_3.830377_2_plen_470_part_00